MQKNYTIKTPADFSSVIIDILKYQTKTQTPNLLITLMGELGAGKTAFVKTLGEHLGIHGPIVSPTFNIMKQYPIGNSDQYEELVHIDAYRLEEATESTPLGLEDMFIQPKKIICIEWPQIIQSIIPNHNIQMTINITSDQNREVVVSYPEL